LSPAPTTGRDGEAAGTASAAVRERLLDAWRDEVQASIAYELIARREGDPRRAEILRRLAAVESSHRDRLDARMRELGIEAPDERTVTLPLWQRLQARLAPVEKLIARQETIEREIAAQIEEQPTGDTKTDELLDEIKAEEEQHTVALGQLLSGGDPEDPRTAAIEARLQRLAKRETWHRSSTGWIPGAIYGANDGLAAVFGIVAGVSGATGGSHVVLTAGLFGAIASALSMAVGAYLAERSTSEVAAANLAHERAEVEKHPEEEKEELSLYYQLKGLTEAEAKQVVERIAENPEHLFRAVALEELGQSDAQGGDAIQAAMAGGLSTAFGAIIPVLPFFWLHGYTGIAVAAAVSLVAHFGVGAAKSVFTLRSAWSSGFEMTMAGLLVGGATYLLGLAIGTG
jgi:VIT1/CCC1 family predicted Fe2+/Mn2+ transporter/rubrerythrin